MLIVFGGLPATGKSTISQQVAQALGAVHLRVDTIEQTLRDVGFENVQGEGYELAYNIAADNLTLGSVVVADSVNPIGLTRNAWLAVATSTGVSTIEIETVCSDPDEHKRRVESRVVNIAGLVLPTWEDVLARDYEPWDRDHLIIDTAGERPEQSLEKTLLLIRSAIKDTPVR